MMKLAQAVGKRTQELLFQKNMTQYRLTKITCLNEKTISDLIKGKTIDVHFFYNLFNSKCIGYDYFRVHKLPTF